MPYGNVRAYLRWQRCNVVKVVFDHFGLVPDVNGCVGELFNGKTAAAQLLVDERTFRIRSLSSGM